MPQVIQHPPRTSHERSGLNVGQRNQSKPPPITNPGPDPLRLVADQIGFADDTPVGRRGPFVYMRLNRHNRGVEDAVPVNPFASDREQ